IREKNRLKRDVIRRERSFLRGRRRWLIHLEDLIGADVFQSLLDAAGPADFDGLGGGFGAETEMDAFVAGGKVAAGGGNSGDLLAAGGDELDFGADGVAIAFVTDELPREPGVLRGGCVGSECRRALCG